MLRLFKRRRDDKLLASCMHVYDVVKDLEQQNHRLKEKLAECERERRESLNGDLRWTAIRLRNLDTRCMTEVNLRAGIRELIAELELRASTLTDEQPATNTNNEETHT